MINAKDKEQSYKTVPEGAYYYGPTFIVGDVHQLLMWGDLWEVKGTDHEVKMVFKLYDVMIKGSGLLQLIRDAKRHRIEFLAVTPRHQSMMGGEGMIVTDINIKEAQ
jgi:hypothetical protein